MTSSERLQWSLLFMRATVFLVLLIWTVDKFFNPEHGAKVFEHFYFIGGVSPQAIRIIGAVELVLIIGFAAGIAKTWTYGFVLVIHAVSTLSSFKNYLDPFTGPNLLFFAAWPMLAACVALFLLRDEDRLASVA